MLTLLFLWSTLYFISISNFTSVSIVSQVGIFLTIVIWFFITGTTYGKYLIFIALAFFVLFNELYVLNLLSIYLAFVLSKKLEIDYLIKASVLFSFVIACISIIHFYSGATLLYTPIHYQHYYLPSIYRLIGLDASPTIVSFSAGLALLLLLFYRRFLSLGITFLIIFFIVVIFLTASRVALLGLVVAFVVAFLKRSMFSTVGVLLFLFPVICSVIYMSVDDNRAIQILIESISSNRVVNWVNLLHYFLHLNISDFLLGIGKPPVINDPLILVSYSGAYQYQFITYAESSWLKIFVYHGLLVFISLLSILFIFLRHLTDYKSRVLMIYFIFSAIFYDSVISLQYLPFTILFFVILMRMDTKVMKISKD